MAEARQYRGKFALLRHIRRARPFLPPDGSRARHTVDFLTGDAAFHIVTAPDWRKRTQAMNRQQRRKTAKANGRGGSGISAAPAALRQRFQEAVGLFHGGRLAEAEDLLRSIDLMQPKISEVGHTRGVIALQLGAPDEAVRHFEMAIAGNPRLADLHVLLGAAHAGRGDPPAAIACFSKALKLDPGSAAAYYQLGLARNNIGDYAAAIDCLRTADRLLPGQADVQITLSTSYSMSQQYGAAETAARAALAAAPNDFRAHSNLARALQGLGRAAAADDAMRQALAVAPEDAGLHVNHGLILEDIGDMDAAKAAYRKAIALEPQYAGGHVNLGLLLLLTGAYEDGWREYGWRWRWQEDGRALRPFPSPLWDGASLSGRTVLAWGDEGPGDEILFASLLPDLVATATAVVVECEPRLVELFRRAFPTIEVHPRRDRPVRRLLKPDIDCHTPFTELPRYLRPNLREAPRPRGPYLGADPRLAGPCRARYRALGDGPVVGVAWSSANLHRPNRNIPLTEWDAILSLPGLTFLSLQYGDHGDEIAEVKNRLGVTIHEDPEIDQIASLEQFAAQIDAVDIVVSITNTTVHMAGALGKTVWTMLPFMPDWRYQLGRDDTAWYPSMRLFRQRRARHWDEVVEDVAAELGAFRDRVAGTPPH